MSHTLAQIPATSTNGLETQSDGSVGHNSTVTSHMLGSVTLEYIHCIVYQKFDNFFAIGFKMCFTHLKS